jgi:hypothetical protein
MRYQYFSFYTLELCRRYQECLYSNCNSNYLRVIIEKKNQKDWLLTPKILPFYYFIFVVIQGNRENKQN